MAAAKKNEPAPAGVRSLWAGLRSQSSVQGWVALVLVVLGIFAGGVLVLWRYVGDRVLSSGAYYLTGPESLQITPLPEWIHSDLRGEVFRDLTLDGAVSLMDDRLAQRVSDAFAVHPWVARVRRVVKQHPSRVSVELEYRRPVCMVTVPGGMLPVDAEGVCLPSTDFSPVEASRYPRLANIDSAPVGSLGTRWGDARVVGGAEIAALLGPHWSEFQLQRIAAATGPAEQVAFELFTRNGTRVLWGSAPGANAPGEPPAAEKLARLKQYASEHGGLETPQGPVDLDVRGAQGLRVSARADSSPAVNPR